MNTFGAKFRNFFEIFYDSVTLYVKNIKLRVIWDGLVIIFYRKLFGWANFKSFKIISEENWVRRTEDTQEGHLRSEDEFETRRKSPKNF